MNRLYYDRRKRIHDALILLAFALGTLAVLVAMYRMGILQ